MRLILTATESATSTAHKTELVPYPPIMSDLYSRMRRDVAELKRLNRRFKESDCFYCGDKATSWDHTIPHSLTCPEGVLRRWEYDIVPACHECNSLLSNKVHSCLYDRLLYLYDKVYKRNKPILSSPEWTDAELVDMGDNLRLEIMASRHAKFTARYRIETLKRNVSLTKNMRV